MQGYKCETTIVCLRLHTVYCFMFLSFLLQILKLDNRRIYKTIFFFKRKYSFNTKEKRQSFPTISSLNTMKVVRIKIWVAIYPLTFKINNPKFLPVHLRGSDSEPYPQFLKATAKLSSSIIDAWFGGPCSPYSLYKALQMKQLYTVSHYVIHYYFAKHFESLR